MPDNKKQGLTATCAEQSGNDGMSDSVKQEITEGLHQEGQGADKGITITAGACHFYDFETCEGIDLKNSKVPYFVCFRDDMFKL